MTVLFRQSDSTTRNRRDMMSAAVSVGRFVHGRREQPKSAEEFIADIKASPKDGSPVL